jgi:hypothetical protein
VTELPPEIAEYIYRTCQRLGEAPDDFVEEFHRDFTAREPRITTVAPPDGRAITDRLARAALWAALTGDPMEQIVATLRQVGYENAREGFPGSAYTTAGHSLMGAARECYPGDWTGYFSSGWAGYVQWLNLSFLSGAAMLPRPAPPPPEPEEPPERPRRRRRSLDDDEATSRGYGHLMVSMTRNRKEKPPKR